MEDRDARPFVPPLLVAVGEWSWRFLVGIAAAVVLGYLLLKLAVVVVPVVLALFLAAVLEPAASALRRRGLHRALAAAIVFVVFLGVFVSVLAWIGTSVAGQLDQVGERLQEAVDDGKRFLDDNFDVSEADVARIEDQVKSGFNTAGGGGVARSAIGGARMASQVLGGVVLTLFSLFFILKDGDRMGEWVQKWTPSRFKEDGAVVARKARAVMRQYLIATAATGFIDGVLIGLALWIIGVPLALPIAVLTFIGGFFPIVGATLAGLVGTAVALVTGGVTDAALVLAATIAVQQVEGNLLQPLILGPAVHLHALVTVLAVAGGLAIGGLLGAFLAVPVVAIAFQVADFYRTRDEPEPESAAPT